MFLKRLIKTYIKRIYLGRIACFSIKMDDCWLSLIQEGLDTEIINYERLTQLYDGICLRNELDIIINSVGNPWAPFKATMVSVMAKLVYPDWDTRNHQKQIGGHRSLRTIDKTRVSKLLVELGLYDTLTEFALTRSFEKAEPYTKEYSGMITPKECKPAFLNIVHIINTTNNPTLLKDMLAYLLAALKARKSKITALKNTVVVVTKNIDLVDINNMFDTMNNLGSGSSVVPAIIVHTLLSVIQPYIWPNLSIKPLKEHTAPDGHTKSFGDVEAFGSNLKPVIVIEVKHKISIDDSIVTIFDNKTNTEDIPLKFIITTAKQPRKIVKNNICIDTLSNFVSLHLQSALLHEKTICSKFIEELRKQIINYNNLSVPIKQTVAEYLTSLLA